MTAARRTGPRHALHDEIERIPSPLPARELAGLRRRLPELLEAIQLDLRLAAGDFSGPDPESALCWLLHARHDINRALGKYGRAT